MTIFDWIAASIVIVSFFYISFVLTVTGWLSALQKGQAVTLLPERKGLIWPHWTQIAMIVLGLLICIPFFYYLWIPIFSLFRSTLYLPRTIGLLIYLGGFAFVLWARRTLGKNWGISTNKQVKLFADHQLVQSGPYAFVRHPMYFGWWVCLFGLTILYPVWAVLLLLIFSIISFIGRARREESALGERFGRSWSEYKQRSKFLIPFIY